MRDWIFWGCVAFNLLECFYNAHQGRKHDRICREHEERFDALYWETLTQMLEEDDFP